MSENSAAPRVHQQETIYPLPKGVRVIFHAQSILPHGPVNFIHDPAGLTRHGPFFATSQPINKAPQILVDSSATLKELEDQTYQQVQQGNFGVVEKLMAGGASARLEEFALSQVSAGAGAKGAREYFQRVGAYFVSPTNFS